MTKPEKKNRYFIALAFIGECCQGAHVRTRVVSATSSAAADFKADSLAARLRAQGYDVTDREVVRVTPARRI